MSQKHSLKTQIFFLALTFIGLLLLGSIFSFQRQKVALRGLEASFKEDLGVVAKIPLLTDVLREIDLSTEEFLLTQNPNLLIERNSSIGMLHKITNGLELLSKDPQLSESWKEFKTKTQAYLDMQEKWIRERQQGVLSTTLTMQIILAQSPANELEEMAGHIEDVKLSRLDAQRKNTQWQFLYTLIFLMTTLLISCGIVVWMLRAFVIKPLIGLNRDIRRWTAGCDWPSENIPTNLEFEKVQQQLQNMAQRINQQFDQELELRKLKSHLVSWISHELLNALAVIGGATDELQDMDPMPLSAEREKLYKMVQARIQSISLTSGNLLNLGKAESGKLKIKTGHTELKPLLSDCHESLKFLSEKKQVKVHVVGEGDSVSVVADPVTLKLVLQNLLSNAIKYTPQGGQIEMGYAPDSSDERKVEIFVEDSGIGISPADQERILTGYYRTEESQLMAEGYGAGLLLVKAILDAHGAHLAIRSQLKQGTRFSFSLPRAV
jgi:signal transduction histidine kinase